LLSFGLFCLLFLLNAGVKAQIANESDLLAVLDDRNSRFATTDYQGPESRLVAFVDNSSKPLTRPALKQPNLRAATSTTAASTVAALANETLPVGTLVIAMDNTLQGTGSNFNLKAYGLLVRLLHAGIPLKWAINPTKAKDGIDFTANASRIAPSAQASASRSFRSGPFIVFPGFETQAQTVISSYGNNVNVYQLTAAATNVPIYSDITHKPRVAVLNNGGNADIHESVYSEAGMTLNTHYQRVASAASLTSTSCFTFASEAHTDNNDINSTEKNAVEAFVRGGGNFLGQCAAVRAYTTLGLLAGYSTDGGISDPFTYENSDEPYAQFQGAIDNEGGSVTSFKLTSDPGQRIVREPSDPARYKAYVGKLTNVTAAAGGYVHYLAGHNYDGSGLEQINGQRMLLNAMMRPADRPSSCGLTLGPQAVDDVGSVIECGQSVTINVLANDSNPTGGALTVSLPNGGNGAHGTFVRNSNNTVTYTLTDDFFSGTDQITYRICNSSNVCAEAIISISGGNTLKVGGTVFIDANQNQTQQSGEGGQSNVTVRLYVDSNNNGIRDNGENTEAATAQVTNGSGDYTFTITNPPAFSQTIPVSNLAISSSTDDSFQKTNNDNKPTNAEESSIIWRGYRFPNLNIPANATITSATLTVTGYRRGPTTAVIKAENLKSPPGYTSANNYLSSRSTTTQSTSWSIPSVTDGTNYTSPNFSNVVQQVVTNQSGITHLSLIISTGDDDLELWNFDDGAANAAKRPKLNLTYTIPGDPANYVVVVDQNTLPNGATFTTDNVERANFTALGQIDCENNFGIRLATIDAVDDDFRSTPTAKGGTTPTVFTNDNANGTSPATDALLTTPTIVNNGGMVGVTINSAGIITVPANTPGGDYTVRYRICLESNQTICDEANVLIRVNRTIDAVDDNFLSTTIPTTGGTTATVFTNDVADGVSPATDPLLRTPTIVNNGGMTGVTINSAGVITVPANTPPGDYTVRYRICLEADGSVCDEANVQIRVVCPNIPTPAASVTVQPTCALPTGTVVFTAPTTGVQYSIDGTNYQAGATFTGVAPGTYTLRVRSTSSNTCITTGGTVTVNPAPTAPATPVASVTAQPTCAVPTGTIVFTAPTTGVQYSINGTTYQASATFTGVAPGTYTLRVRSTGDNTCITTGGTVTVNPAPTAPATPVASVTVQPTCAVPTGTVVFTAPTTGVQYSINGTTYQASATFTGVAPGTYTLRVRSTGDNTCITTGGTVTVNPAPTAPATPVASVTVQPTCAVPTGTIVFTAPTTGVQYSINGTTYQASATFTGVAPGTYTLRVRSTGDNTCITTGGTVTVNPAPTAPATPQASVTAQPTCAVPTGTIVFTAPTTGVQYSIDGTTYQESATFTGVAPGTYTLRVRSTGDNTCITTGATVTVNPVPTPPATPQAGVTAQPTCVVPTGTIVFTAPTTGVQYSIDGTNYQASATFTGVAPGTYTLSVRSTGDNTCITTGGTVTVNPVPAPPANPVVSVNCSLGFGQGVLTVTSPTGSNFEYSLNNGTYQSSVTFNNVANGSQTVRVRNTTTGCVSNPTSVNVNCGCVNGPTLTLTSTSGSTNGTIPITVSGNTFGGSATSVTITENGAGAISPTSSNTSPFSFTYTPVAADRGNTITITVTTNNPAGAPCVAATEIYTLIVNRTIDAVDDNFLSTTIPTTGGTTATVFTNDVADGVSPATDALLTTPTIVNNGGMTGVTINSAGVITVPASTPPGDYTVRYRICLEADGSVCDEANVLIRVVCPNIPTPVASVTVQPTCALPTGTVVFTAPTTGVQYSIDGTNYQAGATFTGVAPGTYTLRVRSTSSNTCITTGGTVTVNPAPTAPATPVASVTVQPTCALPTGTIVFTAPTTGVQYSIDGTNYQAGATFTGVAPGTYTLRVRSTGDNTCITTGGTVTVNPAPGAPATPVASVTVQPTCALPTGTIVFTAPTTGVQYSIDGTNYQAGATFTGVAPGTYTLRVRSTGDNTCITTGGTVTVNPAPGAPATPVASVTVQPTCALPTGTVVFTAPTTGVQYSIDGTTYQASATFTGVAPGTYTLRVRSTGDNTCITTGGTVTVNPAPTAPATPQASVTAQPTCAVPTGTIVFTAPTTGVQYSIDGTNYQASATFTGVAPGTYTLRVRNTGDNTCITTGGTVTVNPAPGAPATPVASVTAQPTCALPTGTIVFTAPTTGVQYSIDGTNYQAGATFTGVTPGTYTLSVRSTGDNTCITTGATVTVNAVPLPPATPLGSVTIQPSCVSPTGTIVFTAPTTGVQYSINGTTYQASATFTGVAPGTYTLRVRTTGDNTCITTGGTVTVNEPPVAPILNTYTSTNACPAETVNLNTITANNVPNGLTRTWHTGTPATNANKISGTNAGAGTYYAAFFDAANNCYGPTSLVVTVTITTCCPTITNNVGSNSGPSSCLGSDGSITICGLTPNRSGYTINFSRNSGPVSSINFTANASGCFTIFGLSAGQYSSILVTHPIDCPGGSNILGPITLVDPVPPTIGKGNTQNTSACGAADGFIQITGLTAGQEYLLTYEKNGQAQTPITFTASSTTYTIQNLTSGNYTNIKVRNRNCESNTLSHTIFDPFTPILNITAKTDPTLCGANDGTFTVSGLAPGTYTLFYLRDGFQQTPITFTIAGTSYTVQGLTRGTYTNVRVIINGCVSNSANVTLNDPGAPVISLGTPIQPSACGFADGSIIITGLTDGVTYKLRYRKDGIFQTPITFIANGASYTIANLPAAIYSNIYVDQGGCRSNSLLQVLKDPGGATIAVASTSIPTICGANDGSITISGLSNGLQYILNYVYNGVQQSSTTFTAVGTTYVLGSLTAGSYTGINVTQGGCKSNSVNLILNNPNGPSIDADVIDTKTCVPGNDGAIIVTGLAQGVNYTLTYKKNGVAQSQISITNSASTSYIINGLTVGTYSEIKVNQGGCVSNEVGVEITGPASPPAPNVANTLSNDCPAVTADLTSLTATNNPGLTLNWHSGTPATAGNIIPVPEDVAAGTYYAAYFNSLTGCYGPTTPVVVTIVTCTFPPIAVNDVAVTPVNTPVTANVLVNDSDPQGSPLTVNTTPTSNPSNGTVALQSNGNYTYTPTAGFVGEDTFCYEITNGFGLKATACVVIDVLPNLVPLNNPPVAVDDNTETAQNTVVTVVILANDTDPDDPNTPNGTLGNPVKLTDPANGTAVFNANGTVTYTPAAGFTGTDSFTYRICDNGTPFLCDEATVRIIVKPTPPVGNQPPVAVDDAEVTPVNTPVSNTVAANDSDPDNTPTQLTYTKLTDPANGGVTFNSNGTYTYTPAPNFVGNVSFTYRVCDPSNACDVATVSIAVLAKAPIAMNDVAVTPVNTPVTANVLVNDSDPQGSPLTVNTTPTSNPSNGTVALQSNGSYTYTPTAGFVGEDTFCYEITNGLGLKATACVVIDVLPNLVPLNNPPVAVDDNTETVLNTPVAILILANDADPDDPNTPNGTLGLPNVLTFPANGAVGIDINGNVFTYAPDAGFTGTDSFTYRICDNGNPNLCDEATVRIIVKPTPPAGNRPPVAVDDAEVTPVNTPVSNTVAANDSDPDNTPTQLTYTKLTDPANGGVTFNSNGTYTYTPAPNFVGNVSFTYRVCDPSNACDVATVSIAVLAKAPIAMNDVAVTPLNIPVTANVLVNDSDPQGSPLTVNTTPTSNPSNGTVALQSNGSYTYTPTAGFVGEDTFCYEITNGLGLKATACVVIDVLPNLVPLNNPPVAVDDNTETALNTAVTIVVKANDNDPDDSNTPNGTLGNPVKLTDPANGTVVFNANGTVTYTPATGFSGTDSFTYRICDNGTPNLCDEATVRIIVKPTPPVGNQPPVAVDDAEVTLVDTPVSNTVAANDSDPDNTPTQLTYTKLTDPANGGVTFNSNGTYTYTPDPNFVGNDNFTYRVCDPSNACDVATVSIAVLAKAPSPQADLAVTKTNGTTSYIAGTTTTYTIVVSNLGPSNVTGASFTDNIPVGTSWSYTSVVSGGASGNTASGSGNISDLLNIPIGGSITYTVLVTIPSNFTGNLINTAIISPPAGTIDPVLDNNTVTDTDTQDPQADLAIVKTVSNATPTVGSNIVFTLTVTNNGPSAATGVSVSDLLPSGYTYVSDNGAGAYVSGTGVWTIGNLASGANAALQITATVRAAGTYANTATVTGNQNDPTPGNNTSTNTPVPVAQADLAIVKTVNNATPTVGSNIVFTLTVTNNGPSPATGVSVSDLLPSGYTYVSDNGAGAYVSGTGVWTIGNLASGANAALQITATVNATGITSNTATVTGRETDPVPGNNSSTVIPGPVPQADLAIVKTVSNATPVVGSNIVFTLTVTNNGPSPATGVSVADLLPSGYTYVSDNGAGAYVSGTGVWTIGNLASGANAALQITATVRAAGTYANTATVTGNQNDPTPGNNTSTNTPVPVPQADLAIVKTVSNATPVVGSNIVFTLTVTNNGPSPATGVSVADLLPSGYTYVSDNGAGAYVSGTGVWTIGNLASGANAALQITATVRAAGTYANTATVTGNQNDPTPGNNTSTNTPVPVAQADLAIVKTVSNATPTVGSNIVFTLTVTNNGPSAATGVSVADLLPSGYTYVSDNGAGAYVSGTGVWTVGNLASGANAALQITATVRAAGTYANTATVTGNQNDPTPGNNTSTNTPVPGVIIVASYDNLGTVPSGGTLVKPLLVNDTLNGVGNFNPTLVNITVTKTPNKGTASINPTTGQVTYTPNAGASGTDSLIYRICDKLNPAVCDTALVVVNINGSLVLLPKVYLQGSLFGVTYSDAPTNSIVDSLMRDDLRVKNLIPLTSPYSYWNPTIPANTILPSVLTTTGTNAIVDWVFVELRDSADSTKIIRSQSALVQRDGDIVDLDGLSPIQVQAQEENSYYVAVRHRNHLAVMTAGAIPLTATGTTIDFRKPTTPTYVFGPQPVHQSQVVVLQGRAMWAGNALRDSVVIYQGTLNDVNVVAQQVINAGGNTFKDPNYILNGYFSGDINMNGEVIFQGTSNDVEFIYQNIINNHPGNAFKDNFYIIQQQLPK
jgi:uncharacterized repeat protein (TIGR01451 family)